jgi:hypothetical protein
VASLIIEVLVHVEIIVGLRLDDGQATSLIFFHKMLRIPFAVPDGR